MREFFLLIAVLSAGFAQAAVGSAELQRRIDAAPFGSLELDEGVYEISETLVITNACSLRMHQNAVLRAVKPMACVVDANLIAVRNDSYRMAITGGTIDGNGLASCLQADGFCHFTLRDTCFLNGKEYGLWSGGRRLHDCELIAENLYFKCTKRGLAGNTAVRVSGSDDHFTDIIVLDWTVGFDLPTGVHNRFTRCHVWGGRIPPAKPGEEREMLKNSVAFRTGPDAWHNFFHQCYADTAKIGFDNAGNDSLYTGCVYYNNYKSYKLDDVIAVRQTGGSIRFFDGVLSKSCPKFRAYEGTGKIQWRSTVNQPK